MGFRCVFEKTLIDLTAWKSALLIVPLVTIFMVGGVSMACSEGQSSLQMRTYFTTSQLLLVAYFALSGFLTSMLISCSAAGFVAKEENDGTLLILTSKPIRRRDVLFGKLAALLARTALLEAILLILLAVGTCLVLDLDETAMVSFLRAVLWLLCYSFLTMCLFATVTTALSTLTRNLVAIMAVMSIMVMACFIVGPLIRSVMPTDGGFYMRYDLYYVDPSYHLQNAFVPFWAQASGGEIIPQFSGWFGFRYIVTQPDGLYLDPVRTCGYFHPLASFAVLLSISALALLVACVAFERKDVH